MFALNKRILKKINCHLLATISITIFFCSCGSIKEIPKYSFSDGYYRSKNFDNKKSKVYIVNADDSVFVYKINVKNKHIIDSSYAKLAFPQYKSDSKILNSNFKQASFDLDFLTIPFKYRPQTDIFPPQFNTNLNGVIYIGYRNDIYKINYKKTPIKTYNRKTTHYGFSYGLFTGFGGTAMNPWVTDNQISSEYDGVVWSKGVAAIIGIDNFTIGLALGADNLLDRNSRYWIYENKPWFGLAFGLNLN
ncbi:MAG: hypothetical protein IPH32_15985 [Bacteroidetes bacterium]|nr:hypothetical protein [Bacteroidota bacterium]